MKESCACLFDAESGVLVNNLCVAHQRIVDAAVARAKPDGQRVVEYPRWIPVGERLPEEDSFVLGFGASEDRSSVNTVRYINGEFRHIFQSPVSHWMPLPPAPGVVSNVARPTVEDTLKQAVEAVRPIVEREREAAGYVPDHVANERIQGDTLNQAQVCYSEILQAAREVGREDASKLPPSMTRLWDAIYGAEPVFAAFAGSPPVVSRPTGWTDERAEHERRLARGNEGANVMAELGIPPQFISFPAAERIYQAMLAADVPPKMDVPVWLVERQIGGRPAYLSMQMQDFDFDPHRALRFGDSVTAKRISSRFGYDSRSGAKPVQHLFMDDAPKVGNATTGLIDTDFPDGVRNCGR